MALVSGLVISALARWTSEWEGRIALRQLESELRDSARLFGMQFHFDLNDAQARARASDVLSALATGSGRRYAVIEYDGTVYADSSRQAPTLESFRNRAEFIAARQAGSARAESIDPADGRRWIDFYEPIGDPARHIGFVRVGSPLAPVAAARQRAAVATFATGAACWFASLLWVWNRSPRPNDTRCDEDGAGPPNSDRPLDDKQPPLVDFPRRLRHRVDGVERSVADDDRELLSTVLAGMIEGVVAIDPQERVLFANATARYMLDLSSQIAGRPIWELVRNQQIAEVTRNALAGHENRPVELELRRAQTVVAVRASRLPGSPCPGVVLVLHDVTGLRRLERLRHEFVSNVSHELKTPLASIQAYTETLLSGAIDDPAHNRQFLSRIEEQADRLHKLILDLLRLARIESGRDVFEVVAVSLDRTVRSSVESHEAVARSKKIQLDVEPPPSPVRVQADADGLRTVLDNLIDNAIKYTPSGGRVTIGWTVENERAVVRVADTGVGIEERHLERIFERFYRVDKARSRDLGGTGLGLAIVKHLVQVFGGDVDVRSRPGHGSEFRVRLLLSQ